MLTQSPSPQLQHRHPGSSFRTTGEGELRMRKTVMSPKLKPLLLPQIVEDQRKLELLHQHHQHQQQQQQLLQQQQQQLLNDADHSLIYSSHSSSSSDLTSASPVTPTFSRTHSRYSGSASSLEMIASASSESPSSPTQPAQVNKNKSPLPDVQEDPSEREEDSAFVSGECDEEYGLYDCLCVEPCGHHTHFAQSPTTYPCVVSDIDFDFMLDSDINGPPQQKRRRHGSDVGFTSWGSRLGSKLSSLPRWGSTSRRHHFAFSPASDPSLDQPPAFSRAASSRSSSVSVPGRIMADRVMEPPLPVTPALSFYDSTESVNLPSPADITQTTAGKRLERERALATTPLLPPLLTDNAARQTHASPLQSPTVAPSQGPNSTTHQTYPTPPLSTKASVSSFRRGTISGSIDIPPQGPYIPDHQDAWSNRLGHANFTIEPKPYVPENADLASLHAFLGDWDLARINYTKHLVRTGEHYGTTSKTYVLTEQKWAEIEQEWHRADDDLRNRLNPDGNGYALVNSHLRRTTDDMLPAAIPRMLSDDGKFPNRGDMDIVGPMARDACMARDIQDDKKHSASVWLKNIAEKVGLRR